MNKQVKIFEIFAEALNLPPETLSLPGKREGFENWDSLVHLQLIMSLEQAFNIRLTTEEVIQLDSIQRCIEIITDKTSES